MDTPPPLRWLISCDESGIHGARFYGFGTLWMPYQRRGDFLDLVADIRLRHHYRDEFKWNNIGRRFAPAYLDLIDLFFQTKWLAFHAVVCPTSMVRHELHQNDQEMYQKHFTMLLVDKVRRCMRRHRAREHTFRVWVDPLPNSYSKANEVVERIGNSVLRQVFGDIRPIDGVKVMESHQTPSIQLCDVLLGATMATWQDKTTAQHKLEVQRTIASYLGWADLRSDTARSERKFNVWMFHDPNRGRRVATTRNVVLRHPLP